MTSVGAVADHVIIGRSMLPMTGEPGPGFVAVADGDIIALETSGRSPDDLIGSRTIVTDAGDGSVVPGLHDDHTFFTSQLLEHAGVADPTDVDALALARAARDAGRTLFLRDLDDGRLEVLTERIETECPGTDAVLLASDRATLALTASATSRLGDLDPQSNESLQPLYAQLAADEPAVRRAFLAAQTRMHRGGVVSVKDIAFDTHLGMLDIVDDMLAAGELDLDYSFAAQPVARPADLAAGEAWRHREGARFHGFKLMTDGSFDEGTADLLPPDDDRRRRQIADVDYGALAEEARRILDAGFALALNADGDAAVRACLDVFEAYGPLPPRCSVSDASLVHDHDAARIGRLGLHVETYPQMLRFPGYDIALLDELLGADRGGRLANLRGMLDAPTPPVVTAATDFPLFDPSLPEAILSASLRMLGDGRPEERWFSERAIGREAVVRMWTAASATVRGAGHGVLAVGGPANIVVYPVDLMHAGPDELAGTEPVLVMRRGRVVHAA